MDKNIVIYALAIILNKNNQFLLSKRKNTKWFSDHYGLIGGKVELDESIKDALKREIKEEVNLIISDENIELAHTMNFIGQTKECMAFFFFIKDWQGEIINNETNKQESLEWFDFTNLPENLIPRHKKALNLISNKIYYSEDNFR